MKAEFHATFLKNALLVLIYQVLEEDVPPLKIKTIWELKGMMLQLRWMSMNAKVCIPIATH